MTTFYEKEESVGKVGYMCKTDYDYHLEYDEEPVEIYNSIHNLKRKRACVSECGIVKVSIKLVEVIDHGSN